MITKTLYIVSNEDTTLCFHPTRKIARVCMSIKAKKLGYEKLDIDTYGNDCDKQLKVTTAKICYVG